ncbi:beta-N-acetylhexosaminidase family protein [Sphingomonas silueang]|uniref:beta-N-acetylhexosaminidase family protein n=1 Tax=Sphingomonas silueang TaxID=3156617 RepID=UPI0032B3D573
MARHWSTFGGLAVTLWAGAAWAEPVVAPAIFPAPAALTLGEAALPQADRAVLVIAPGSDAESVALVRRSLAAAGIAVVPRGTDAPDTLTIVLGLATAPAVRDALARTDVSVPEQAEGYALVSRRAGRGGVVTLAGRDGDGLFHAAQTLRQLLGQRRIPEVTIRDWPAMPIRGTIEGFYGKPWTTADRTRHLDFLGSVKANTYVYSPKDDPYARDRWREAYPAALLAELGTLAARARANHVDFVYAVSPGPSICFSDANDLKAMERKFDALRAIGVRSFYVALDDIEYTKWNCDADKAAFGPSGAEAAGVAQAKMLNAVQADLLAKDANTRPLIMVPTEYYDAKESPYKAALRQHLNPRIVVQWTGTDVVPPAISIPDAKAATKAFGRKTLLWDNYPVNDYAQTTGRLLMAPYVRREAGLSGELAGILSNPMNQEAPSRVAVTGVAAFAWNDTGYDAQRTWHAAARELAGGDAAATEALLLFFDTQHVAPTFGSQPWQEQAPRLKALFDRVRDAIALGDGEARAAAIADLRAQADALAGAADIIRSGTVDPGFAAQARPWLDALPLWGRALQLSAAGLEAANGGSTAARRYFAEAQALAAQAAAVKTIPGATRFDGTVKIADGVLDRFIADAPGLIAPAPMR